MRFCDFCTIPLQDNLGRIKVSIPGLTRISSSGVQELVKPVKENSFNKTCVSRKDSNPRTQAKVIGSRIDIMNKS